MADPFPAPANDDVDSYGGVVAVYIALGLASVLATLVVAAVSTSSARLRRDHYSSMILIITLCDLLYTLKFVVSAVAWAAGRRDSRASFHLLADNCMSSTSYGVFTGLACISWNAAWIFDFVCVLVNPMRNTAAQRRWYHLAIWSLCVFGTVWTLAAQGHGSAADHTCLVRGTDGSSLVFEVPLVAFLALALASLAYAAVRLSSGTRDTATLRRRLLFRHSAYVLAFVCLWLWPLLHDLLDASDGVYAYVLLEAIAVSGQALVFAAIRLTEPGAWAILQRILRRAARRVSSMARAIDVRIVTRLRLILHVRRVDRDAARLLFRRRVNLVVGLRLTTKLGRQHRRDRRRQRRLAMVHVTNRAHVHVWLVTLKLTLGHFAVAPIRMNMG